MNGVFKSVLRCIGLMIILAVGVTAQAQDTCDMEAVYDVLLQIQAAQQNEDLVAATALMNEAIFQAEYLMENCTVTPLETESPAATEVRIIDTGDLIAVAKDDGFYLVGTDILPGHWESMGTGNSCYWRITDVDGRLIDNHFGMAGGTIIIKETDFQVEFNGCGKIKYVESREPVLVFDAAEPKEDGFFTVGVEIVPGLWRSTGFDEGCYYARRDENMNIIDNHFGNSGITVNVQPTDYEVEFSGCGTWQYLGEPAS